MFAARAAAAAATERALELQPDHVETLSNLLVALLLSGGEPSERAESDELYRRALALRPDDVGMLFDLGLRLSEEPAVA